LFIGLCKKGCAVQYWAASPQRTKDRAPFLEIPWPGVEEIAGKTRLLECAAHYHAMHGNSKKKRYF